MAQTTLRQSRIQTLIKRIPVNCPTISRISGMIRKTADCWDSSFVAIFNQNAAKIQFLHKYSPHVIIIGEGNSRFNGGVFHFYRKSQRIGNHTRCMGHGLSAMLSERKML